MASLATDKQVTGKKQNVAPLTIQDKITKAVEYKGNKCCKCGGSFHQAVYDFHHIDGSTKDACIGHMTHNCRPWTVIQEELDKCEMLCANCHRVEHFV